MRIKSIFNNSQIIFIIGSTLQNSSIHTYYRASAFTFDDL
jgi:hypothetical protein